MSMSNNTYSHTFSIFVTCSKSFHDWESWVLSMYVSLWPWIKSLWLESHLCRLESLQPKHDFWYIPAMPGGRLLLLPWSDYNRVFLNLQWTHGKTRQSEMTNTSPRHMPMLGNVHPIKIENFDIFSWRHFCARSRFFLIFNWYGYPRGSHEKIFEGNCRSSFWDIRHWIVKLDVYLRGMTSLTYVTILSGVHWHTGSMYAKVCNDSLNITIVLGSQSSKYHYTLAWDTLLTPEISKFAYRHYAC